MGRRERELSILTLCLCAAALAVSAVRATLSAVQLRVKEKHDVYLLPPPSQVAFLSLGYRAAFADMLWAHTMVAQGLRISERRRFENIARLYDAINELDPTWRRPYLLAEALITLQTAAITYDEVTATRRILERAVQNRPLDAELWLILGVYVGMSAPSSYLDDRPDEKKRWKLEGARYLARAAELGAADSRVGWQALGGANILQQNGLHEDAIRFYQRQYAMTDDPELRKDIEGKLRRLVGKGQLGKGVALRQELERLRQEELPWVGDVTMMMLGPRPRARCAGIEAPSRNEPECATTWREWAERLERARPVNGW